MATKGVSNVKGTGKILPSEVKPGHELHPASLPAVQSRHTLQVSERLVIGFNHKGTALKIAAPLAKGVDNRKELLFTRSVVTLCRGKLFTGKGNRTTVLQQDSTRTVQGGVGKQLNTKRRRVVGKAQNNVLSDSTLKLIESKLTCRSPSGSGKKSVLARQ